MPDKPRSRARSGPRSGEIILIGAGPGDPGLLTLSALAELERADVVLYDRLLGEGVLSLIPANAHRIDVGKTKGEHTVPQEEINALLVSLARAGERVVRLKGGDPYLFGRGAEELEAAVREGIPFRVIPGVTSALAAPSCAGIPVTHRDYASSVHIMTGHGKRGEAPAIPYAELAKLRGTLVFLMSLSVADAICGGLIAAGMSPDTPAAAIENGARANQRRVSSTLGGLPGAAREAGVSSPALLVVGAVCGLADALDWRGRLPLSGRRVLAVASGDNAGRLASLLREDGCRVDEFAAIGPTPLDVPETFWSSVGGYSWIVFTSRFGAELFFEQMTSRRLDLRRLGAVRFAVVGLRTGSVLEKRGIYPDYIPETYNGAALGEGLSRTARPDERILLYRAESGADELPRALSAAGLKYDDVPAYRTERRPMPESLRRDVAEGVFDAATFTSASAVESFVESSGATLPLAFCIGDMTAAAAKSHGMKTEVAAEATIESLAELVRKNFDGGGGK